MAGRVPNSLLYFPLCAPLYEVCDKHSDVATASPIENWIDETERRTWFLSEIIVASNRARYI